MATNLTEAYYRRLYSFHEPTEEFYAKDQPRDKDGKWTRSRKGGKATPVRQKVWSGISPAPGDRTPPKNMLRHQPFDSMSSGFMSRLGHKIYDADLGDGYHSRVVETSPGYDNTMYIRGYIYKGKSQVGAFERTLIQKNGKLIANHDDLEINAAHQGHGLADRFNGHTVAEYQKLGVDQITLKAGLTVGGYAWARQGFRFNDEEAPGARQRFLSNRLGVAEAHIKYSPVLKPFRTEMLKEAEALRRAIDAGEDVQPIHLAALGEKHKFKMYDDDGNEYQTWAGKSSLLGTDWSAAYYFDAANPVVASATSLEHAALREPQEDLILRIETEEFFNKYHSKTDGRFTSRPRVEIIKGTMKNRKPILKELDAQGLDKMNPLRHIFQSWMANRLAVVRNDKGEIVGGVQFDVDKTLHEVTVRDMRMLEQRSGHGTSTFVEMAKIAKELDYDMSVTNAVSSAKPFYAKLGGHFREGSASGHWTDETRDALASGHPKAGQFDMEWQKWSDLPMWTAAARHAARTASAVFHGEIRLDNSD